MEHKSHAGTMQQALADLGEAQRQADQVSQCPSIVRQRSQLLTEHADATDGAAQQMPTNHMTHDGVHIIQQLLITFMPD